MPHFTCSRATADFQPRLSINMPVGAQLLCISGNEWSRERKFHQRAQLLCSVSNGQTELSEVLTSLLESLLLHCALAVMQCIVIGPVCGFVAGFTGSVTTIT